MNNYKKKYLKLKEYILELDNRIEFINYENQYLLAYNAYNVNNLQRINKEIDTLQNEIKFVYDSKNKNNSISLQTGGNRVKDSIQLPKTGQKTLTNTHGKIIFPIKYKV